MVKPYYDKIARAWHEATGAHGGPLKKYALNNLLIQKIGSIAGSSILEVGAGTGYFLRLLRQRRTGEVPAKITVTDQSDVLLRLAQDTFPVSGAEYRQVDLRRALPFPDQSYDLMLATMVFNEIGPKDLPNAVSECFRVLGISGRLLATVVHPRFVSRLDKSGKLARLGSHFRTMPGKGTLRLPVVPRSQRAYEKVLTEAGFTFDAEEIYPTEKMQYERPGLRCAAGEPLALVLDCKKPAD